MICVQGDDMGLTRDLVLRLDSGIRYNITINNYNYKAILILANAKGNYKE